MTESKKSYKEKESYITVKPNPSLWKDHANYNIMCDTKSLIEYAVCADLGCNHGSCTILLHDLNPLHVDGYDINKTALQVAQRIASDYNVSNKTNFIEADLTDIPVEDEQYDLITSFHTLEHIYECDVDNVIKEMHRILKPKGHILISIPYKHNYPDPCHVAFYDETTLKDLFEKHNFKTVYCIQDNRWKEKGLLTALFYK
jgi:ubiquinone/menaquinone biosynthesis C-methylase UbiE